MELLFELSNVVIKDSEDGKSTACKKWARKIVNCYRMSAELREGTRQAKDFIERLSMTFTADGKRQRLPLIFYSFVVILQ